MKRLAPVLAALFVALPATAQERVLSPEKAAGFDTLVTQCVSFTREDFANGMCDPLMDAVAATARANGLEVRHLGRTEWGFGTDEYLTSDAKLKNPVHLTAYIRATDTPTAAFIWLSLYADANGPRPGRLVLWEDSGIGAGDTGVISGGLSQGLAQKLVPVIETLAAGRP